MSHVDLCSGIGGFALGFEWAGLSKPVLFCDIEPWSRKVLQKHWPDVPIAEDVKELANDPARLVPDCDILTAGYPCQPFSQAGKQRGTEDDRHIWPFISQIIAHKRPAFAVFENVYGHVALGLDEVLADLEAQNYATRAFIVPACAVDAPHRRDRLWIIAHANSQGEPDGTINEQRMVGHTEDNGRNRWATQAGRERAQDFTKQPQPSVRSEFSRPSEDVADTNGKGLQGHLEQQTKSADTFIGCGENVADTKSDRNRRDSRELSAAKEQPSGKESRQITDRCRENVADTYSERRRLRHTEWQDAEDAGQSPGGQKHGGWDFEPRMGDLVDGLPKGLDRFDGWEREPADIPRVATGVKDRKNRLKGLGNAIVPSIAMQIGLTIKAVRDG